MTESKDKRPRYIPDVNVLLALSDKDHLHHRVAVNWFSSIRGAPILLCAVTEAGFVRLASNPLVGRRKVDEAIEMLELIRKLSNCACLLIDNGWLELIDPVRLRMSGYRQVTDALLLGLAIKHDAVLVTLDQKIKVLAGQEFKANLLKLQ